MPYQDQLQNTGSYVQQTPTFDVSQLYSVEIGSPEFKELLVRLYQQVNNISLGLNTKETGFYLPDEFVTGGLYYPRLGFNQLEQRPVFRKCFQTTLAAGVNNINHGITITATTALVKLFGLANNTVSFNYYPLPFASAGGATNIELRVNATQIVITNNSGLTFDDVRITLEYTKS